jgi:citronellol/citronellal dehydrogenase
MVSKYALPHLLKSANPHILMLSPPLDMQEKWFAPATAYAMAKFGMSLVVLGLAGEQRGKIAVNALWPRTTIATAAVKNLLGGDALMNMSRTPDILAEAAWRIFQKPKTFTGNFIIDDTFLASEGIIDFDQYRVNSSQPLQVDFFVPDNVPPPPGVSLKALK